MGVRVKNSGQEFLKGDIKVDLPSKGLFSEYFNQVGPNEQACSQEHSLQPCRGCGW